MYPVLPLHNNHILHVFSLFLGLFRLLFMSAVCAVEINPLITHYCISLILTDTISYPRLFTPQHVGAHTHTSTHTHAAHSIVVLMQVR